VTLRRTVRELAKHSAYGVSTWAWSTSFSLAGRVLRPVAREPDFRGGERVLVIAPHPDDETIGCAGTIALHAQRGDEVFVVAVTDGSASRADVPEQMTMASVRSSEFARAARVLGATGIELGIPESECTEERVFGRLAGVVDRIRPTIVYAPSVVDYHPHHIAVARALAGSISGAPVVRVYETLVPLTPLLANIVVDTSSVSGVVRGAARAYRSQAATVARAARLGAQRRRLWRHTGPIEVFWSLTAAAYRVTMGAPARPIYRGLRDRPFGDGLSWLVGLAHRRRLRTLAAEATAAGRTAGLISLIMPAYNEARTLPTIMARLDSIALPVPWELIVVDDGSTDETARVAAAHAPSSASAFRVERLPENRGKGAAVRRGLEIARGDVIGIQDADLEYAPDDIARLVQPILDGRADVVFGSRTRGRNRPYSISYKFGNLFLSALASILFGRFTSDLYTGYKFMRATALQHCALTADGFEIEAQLGAGLLRAPVTLIEIPISYVPRTRGQGKKIVFRDGLVGLKTLFQIRLGR